MSDQKKYTSNIVIDYLNFCSQHAERTKTTFEYFSQISWRNPFDCDNIVQAHIRWYRIYLVDDAKSIHISEFHFQTEIGRIRFEAHFNIQRSVCAYVCVCACFWHHLNCRSLCDTFVSSEQKKFTWKR